MKTIEVPAVEVLGGYECQKGRELMSVDMLLLDEKNAGNFVHGGATATLVDLIGSAVISRVSVEIIVLKFSLTNS